MSEISSLDGSNGSEGSEPRLAAPARAAGHHSVYSAITVAGSVTPVARGAKNRQARSSRCAPALLSSMMSRIGTVPAADRGACRACRCQANQPAIAVTTVRAVTMAIPPPEAVVGPFALPAPRAAGKIPERSIRGARAQHYSSTVRSTRGRGKALSVMPLALEAGRTGQEGRSIGGAGATPPKTALACTAGPFGEVAP